MCIKKFIKTRQRLSNTVSSYIPPPDQHCQQQQQVLPVSAAEGRRQGSLPRVVPLGSCGLRRPERSHQLWGEPGPGTEDVHEEVSSDIVLYMTL